MNPKKKKIKVNTPVEELLENEAAEITAEDELDVETQADDMPAESAGDASEPVDEVSDADLEEVTETVAEDEEPSLETLLDVAETRAAEYLDSLQRERATFQNYKKRVERERAEQAQQIARGILLRLLPTIDDFHRAMDAVPEGERDEWFEGISLIQRKLEQFLTNEGVTAIEADGAEFDPNFHEAIGVDADTDAESGTITMVLQRGYMHNERVLRPAMVRVAE